ncbi:unnamed protein product [Adineta steineri]|uniref:TRPM SLOG domain-containing protein n=1 Tax=Adineta steineri TaxID=433720 RepID=A0A815NYN1_9BILA|nr:unnamed protein product [Adineta steineri]
MIKIVIEYKELISLIPRNYSDRANFIRIPPNAPPAQVKKLLSRQRSYTVNLSMNELQLFRISSIEYVKAKSCTNVWILTNGINTSIIKLLGEINRTNPDPSQSIHFISIAPWGCVSSVEQLAVYGTNVIYNKPKTDETSFESNHVLLIFIDNDTKHEYGSELEFQSHFTKIYMWKFIFIIK